MFIPAETEPEPIDLIQLFGPWTRYELILRIEFMAEDKIQGLIFVAGLIAKKCAKNNPNLGYYKDKFEPDQKLRETPWFIDGMNRGGMKYPTDEFFESVKLMNLLFEIYHPTLKLRKGTV